MHNHFLKFGTFTDLWNKKVSPELEECLKFERNLKEAVKGHIDSDLRASALNSPYYSVRTTMKKDLHLKPYKYHRFQELTEAHMQQRWVVGFWTETLNRKISSLRTKIGFIQDQLFIVKTPGIVAMKTHMFTTTL